MKIEELKHNHSLTDLLKILLFAILMLAPALSVGTRCLYVIANKNAYQSYSDVSSMETTLISDNSQVIENNNYMINLLDSGNNYSNEIYINSSTIDYDYIAGSEISYVVSIIRFYPNNTHIRFIESNNTAHNYELNDEKRTYLNGQTFNLQSGNLVNPNQAVRFYMVSYTTNKLDNVFEYSVSKLATDQMFTWTQNTPVFTGVEAMCTQLGITAPAIPIIIAYWLILTCVYIVIDIVIKLITYITHLIGARKGA